MPDYQLRPATRGRRSAGGAQDLRATRSSIPRSDSRSQRRWSGNAAHRCAMSSCWHRGARWPRTASRGVVHPIHSRSPWMSVNPRGAGVTTGRVDQAPDDGAASSARTGSILQDISRGQNWRTDVSFYASVSQDSRRGRTRPLPADHGLASPPRYFRSRRGLLCCSSDTGITRTQA